MSEQTLENNFSSNEFLSQIRNRDAVKLELLVRSYTEHLYKGALGLGFNADMAEELVQSVWITFFDVVSNFEGRSHVRTFLFGILYNKASELRRDHKKTEQYDQIDERMERRFLENGRWATPPIDPEQFFISTQTLELIQKCIDDLPTKQRMAFCLKEIDDHGAKDICNILGLTLTNLGVILFRAKNKLRECIEHKSTSGQRGLK